MPDFFIDPHDAGKLAGAARGRFEVSFRRVHSVLSGGGPRHGGASIGATAAPEIQAE